MECERVRYRQGECCEAGVFLGDTCVGSASGERVNKISIVREKCR